jgi:hypothetical protein
MGLRNVILLVIINLVVIWITMTPRQNLFLKPVIGQIDQGSIFSGAYSVDYPDKDLYGIVITPRCDIANKKVSTIHYLPIVRFSDWCKRDLVLLVHEIVIKKFLGELRSKFSDNKLSPELVQIIDTTQLNVVLETSNINSKERTAISEKFLIYQQLKSINGLPSTFLKSHQKEVQMVLKEISEFKRRNFYILESWVDRDEAFIILLREIRSISREFASELAGGCYLKEYPFKRYDDIAHIETLTDDSFASIETVLDSPYMEHLIQTFFQNLGRIGISDYDQDIEERLFSKV